MKKIYLFKTLLLLCALMAGSGSAWADKFNFTYDYSRLKNMLSGSFADASSYWKVPASSGNTATIAIPIDYQPTSNIKITFHIATFGQGTNPSGSNTTITAVGTEASSNWTGSGVSSYPSSSTFVDGEMTITKPASPTTLDGLTITMGVNSGIKIFRLDKITVSYEYSASSVATPTFSPGEGTYTSTQSVAISCETAGTTIYYTLDGSNPSSSSSVYSSAISISETTTVKAMAKIDDDESAIATATYTILPVTHEGTSADPYTISDARNALTAGIINAETDYYVRGYITKKNDITNNGSLTYWLSDNGEMSSTIQCYSGKYIYGAAFTEATDLEVGDIATVKGKLAIYGGSTYQFNSDNEVVSIQARTKVNIATFTATTSTLVLGETTTTNTTVTNDQAGWTPTNYTYASDDETVATVDADGVITAVAKGAANITVTPVVSATDPTYKVGASKSLEIVVKNPSHTAYFSVNGTLSNVLVEEGGDITFPADPADIFGKKFVCWSASAIDGTTDTAPTPVSSPTMGNADVTYYAVFASGTQINGWVKLEASEVSEEGTYALLTTDGHAFKGSITSGHGDATTDAFAFTNGIATSAPEGTCEITLQAVTGGFKMYNEDNGYLYATKAKSGGLAWQQSEGSYWKYESENWKYSSNSAYLRSYNNNSFRTYGTNTNDDIAFAHKTTISSYSGYCTSITTSVTITAAEYATFHSDYAVDFSGTDIKAYTAKDGEISVTLNEITSGKVPANTPVVLYKAGGGTENVPVIASAAAVGNNDLNVSTGEKPTNAYVLAMNPTIGFYLWDSSVTLEEGKVYLQASSGARAFLPFGEATGIEATPNNEAKSNVVFDLQGRRVAKPAKGLYIIDGRKVMVK